jgi:hypothetical protein
MTTLLRTFSVGLLVAAIVVLPTTFLAAQQTQTPPSQTESVRTFEGQLSKVDSTAKTIILKGTDDKEMTFSYNDTTQVVGADDIQGLTGKTGASLKVSYRDNRGSNQATKIEVLPKK